MYISHFENLYKVRWDIHIYLDRISCDLLQVVSIEPFVLLHLICPDMTCVDQTHAEIQEAVREEPPKALINYDWEDRIGRSSGHMSPRKSISRVEYILKCPQCVKGPIPSPVCVLQSDGAPPERVHETTCSLTCFPISRLGKVLPQEHPERSTGQVLGAIMRQLGLDVSENLKRQGGMEGGMSC